MELGGSDTLSRTGAQFQPTRWTVVLTAGGEGELEQLCRTYWPPTYAFLRMKGHSPDDARDLTQGFFLHILSKGRLEEFEVLNPFLTGESERRDYRAAAENLGITEGAARTSASRLRDEFERLLREELEATVDDPAEINNEIRYLFTAFLRRLERS